MKTKCTIQRLLAAILCIVISSSCAAPRANDTIADVALGEPLEVFVNGVGPCRFGIDTGQSFGALVSPALAARLALPVEEKMNASDGTSSREVDVVRVDSIQLGEQRFGAQPALVIEHGDSAMDGTLGFPMFVGDLIEFDYLAKRLRIRQGELPPPDGSFVIPFTVEQGIPVVLIDIAGERVPALVDTGSSAALLVPLAMAQRLPLFDAPIKSGHMRTLFGEFDLWTARLRGSLKIGMHEVVDPAVTFSDYFHEVNIGKGFLGAFRVTFDPARRRMLIER